MNEPPARRPVRGDPNNWPAPLLLRYPLARSVGFECFRGWRPILERLLERLEVAIAAQPIERRDDFRILQIKEKFGRLRVHLSEEGLQEMKAAIDEAEEASVVTCEVCGASGVLADRNGWTSVKCAEHEHWSRLDGII